jgi:hypothetical protein
MLLEELIISRVRVKMLTLFLSKPNEMYHVREIVRQLDEEINAVRRELSHLEKAGLLAKEQRANRLFDHVRKEYPLYFELMELIAKTTGLGWDIVKNRAKLGKMKFAMMSGRFVRALPRKGNSDVDLLIVGSVVLPELGNLVKAEEAKRERELNYTVMTEDEFTFRKRRRDPFVLEILAGSRIMLIGDEEELVN